MWAISVVALIPFSGSSPACAARPWTSMTKSAVPLRPIFTAPFIDASKTKTARALLADSSMRARDALEPTSSSVVQSIATEPEIPCKA